ncbi:uncharacterized protein LOC126885900 isoform X2 [Diabrotica virgifera virgifera]|uniref:Uncharacterized protein n=1 Tax=Diabrotica virgifera virgifera TaxID=50390 RepID=A0ABM5KEN2_DIAVI|nr:uncharacterized protein LOC126885900 isoform X2 [Diabrotica virgifera virgifera]
MIDMCLYFIVFWKETTFLPPGVSTTLKSPAIQQRGPCHQGCNHITKTATTNIRRPGGIQHLQPQSPLQNQQQYHTTSRRYLQLPKAIIFWKETTFLPPGVSTTLKSPAIQQRGPCHQGCNHITKTATTNIRRPGGIQHLQPQSPLQNQQQYHTTSRRYHQLPKAISIIQNC